MHQNMIRFPAVSIVIPTWNGLYLLKQSIDQVVKAKNKYSGKCEIIVVDNGSMDRTIDVLVDYYPDVLIERFDINMGFGYACNRGAEIANGELILFLNNDIYIKDDLIQEMVESFLRLDDPFSLCPETRVWQGKTLTEQVFSSAIKISYDMNGELIQHWLVDNGKNIANKIETTAYGTGAVLLVDKSKFKAIGGFDPIYGLAYWEDVDICLTAWTRGWSSYCDSSIYAWHKISATSEKKGAGDFKRRHMILNYIILQLSSPMDEDLRSAFEVQLEKFLDILKNQVTGEDANYFSGKILELMPEILEKRKKNMLLKNDRVEIESPFFNPDAGWSSYPVLAELINGRS